MYLENPPALKICCPANIATFSDRDFSWCREIISKISKHLSASLLNGNRFVEVTWSGWWKVETQNTIRFGGRCGLGTIRKNGPRETESYVTVCDTRPPHRGVTFVQPVMIKSMTRTTGEKRQTQQEKWGSPTSVPVSSSEKKCGLQCGLVDSKEV